MERSNVRADVRRRRRAADDLTAAQEQTRRDRMRTKVGRPSSEAARLVRGLELMEQYGINPENQ